VFVALLFQLRATFQFINTTVFCGGAEIISVIWPRNIALRSGGGRCIQAFESGRSEGKASPKLGNKFIFAVGLVH